jgi:hypothetical protein
LSQPPTIRPHSLRARAQGSRAEFELRGGEQLAVLGHADGPAQHFHLAVRGGEDLRLVAGLGGFHQQVQHIHRLSGEALAEDEALALREVEEDFFSLKC